MLCLGVVAISLVRARDRRRGALAGDRASRRLAVDMRRLAFDHAVRLPLAACSDLKSGGVASILREDAGGIGRPRLQHALQPVAGDHPAARHACDPRARPTGGCCSARSLLLPTVWITHRTWIGRIRPMYRDIRDQRQAIDAQATEAFGGMRVVRGFARQRSEANRFVARQPPHGPAGTARLVVGPRRRARVGADRSRVASAALLSTAGCRSCDGTLTTGDLVMFLAYLVMLLGPLETLASSATAFQNEPRRRSTACSISCDETRGAARSPRRDRPSSRPRCEGRITFRDVCVHATRTSDEPVLEDISLDAEPGEMVALVGAVGRRQDDALQPRRPLLRPDLGRIDARRQRPARHRPRELPPAARHRRAGRLPLRRHARGEHRLRPPRRDAERHPQRRREAANAARVHRRAAGRATTRSSASAACGSAAGSASASRSPGRPRRPADPDPRRGDEQPRHRERAAHPASLERPACATARAS